MARFLFLAIAALGLLSALGTVLARNLVRAALYLVAFFFCVACLFVMLEAEFLAAVQVLIYIGAVAILLMFGIMLTRNAASAEADLSGGWRVPGLLAGLAVFAALAFGINNAVSPAGTGPWSQVVARPALEPSDAAWKAERSRAVDDMPRVVGEQFMTRYALAFELAGLLLTAALVGAVALAREDETPDDAAGPASDAEADPPVVAPPQHSPTTTAP